ncbi:MAG: CehA/McbA family metallohydrolase [Chloroflexota bacterium]|nr:CehA/McbA family metallohydrolase [Chloroflexota bacterium]
MRYLPFDKPGRFYRGNLHTHSTRSDGRRTPEDVCRIYRELGYDFLAITDHFMERFGYPITDTSQYWTDDFITLLGAELHAGQIECGELWHLLAVGLPGDFAPNLPGETGPQMAQRARAAGAFVAAAHPAWYNLSEEDVLSLGEVEAIEIINGISADHNDRLDSWYMVDRLAARGYRYSALATDDAHFKEHQDVLRGWAWVKAQELTPQAILEALKVGDYYSSTGPMLLDVKIQPKVSVRVRCSPAEHIIVSGKGAEAVSVHGNGLLEAELSLRNWRSDYCRVTVRDRHGEKAWTNMVWFDS